MKFQHLKHCTSRTILSIALAVLIVSSSACSSNAPTASNGSIDYQVSVQAKDGKEIANAQVKIEVGAQAPLIGFTDANGTVRIFIDASREGQPARLTVEAQGYEKYVQNIDLRKEILPPIIQLEAKQSSTPNPQTTDIPNSPTSTSLTQPSPNNTATTQPTEIQSPASTTQSQADDLTWTANYYDNSNFSGAPVVTTNTDTIINFDWGVVSPALGVPNDGFAVRWTRCLDFEGRYYNFSSQANDYIFAYLDDTLVNSGGDTKFLVPAGRHCLRVDYWDRINDASVRFDFKAGQAVPTIDPATAWKGEYFDNDKFSGPPVFTRDDPIIDFDWGFVSPALGVPNDGFAVRWTRCLDFEGRDYNFSSQANDYIFAYLDDTLVNSGGDTKFLVPAGRHCLRVDYWDRINDASVRFDFK